MRHRGMRPVNGEKPKTSRSQQSDDDANGVVQSLTDTGKQRALDDTLDNLQNAAEVMKDAADQIAAAQQITPPPTSVSKDAMDIAILEHERACPAAKGYKQLKTAIIICTTVIGSFLGLFLWLAPGSFENAITKAVSNTMDKQIPLLRRYIDEQVIITSHQYQLIPPRLQSARPNLPQVPSPWATYGESQP